MNETNKITHVSSKRRWIDINLKELWQYRDLYKMYISRDMATYYKQTIFGPLWYVVQPLLTTLIYMFLFGRVAKISTDGVPEALFYLAGIALWNFFNQCLTSCSTIFNVHQSVFSKVYFPRLVVPLASTTSNMIRFLIQYGIFVVVLLWYIVKGTFIPNLGMQLLMLPVLIVIAGLFGMAWGLMFTSWSVRYRDLQYAIPFIMQIGMYVTPVIYPLSFMPESYRWIINLNPLTPIMEAFRYCCLGVGTFNVTGIAYSIGILLVSLFLSIVVFNHKARNFIDVI